MARTTTTNLRVRYSETDQMGTFYNSRVLEWFEVGRTEWLRETAMPYTEMEKRGVMLPLVESHVEYLGRAVYDDELTLAVTAEMSGKARMRYDINITHAKTQSPVARGYTIHAIINPAGKPIRPPQWFLDAITI
ncbi:MAG: acyl-CoA thioesterase [Phycisphaerae bacterium]|nr:acyl-CoA thioesterase [Phycisphaerae bacterium]